MQQRVGSKIVPNPGSEAESVSEEEAGRAENRVLLAWKDKRR
jgi:hypothetical protein